MSFETLLVERDGGVAAVTINRPKVLNALNSETIGELAVAMLELQHDPAVRAIVLTGAGEKAFVAGADINELALLSPARGQQHARKGQTVFDAIEQLGKPVVAAVNGFALGGGCELAMACTIRIAAESAKLGLPEVTLGVIPGYAGTQRLPRIVGRGAAMDLILTGRAVDAQEALRLGLVSQVVPPADLMETARKTALRILRNGPLAVRAAMQAVDHGLDVTLEHGCRMEASLFGLLCATGDMREGLKAFLEKRKAEFKGV